MAYIANTAFEARIVNDRFDDLANIAGKYAENDALADCSAGLLCIRGTQIPCEGFGEEILNENTWYMVPADGADIDTPVYACDPHDWPLIGNGRNLWAVGTETLGLGIPAGRYGSFRRIHFDNVSVYRFGIGNVAGELGENEYFIINSNGLLLPGASAPTTAGNVYFKLRGQGNFTEGTTASFGYIDVVACRVSVAG